MTLVVSPQPGCARAASSLAYKVAERLTAEGWKIERTPEGGLKTVASCGHPLTLDENGSVTSVDCCARLYVELTYAGYGE